MRSIYDLGGLMIANMKKCIWQEFVEKKIYSVVNSYANISVTKYCINIE